MKTALLFLTLFLATLQVQASSSVRRPAFRWLQGDDDAVESDKGKSKDKSKSRSAAAESEEEDDGKSKAKARSVVPTRRSCKLKEEDDKIKSECKAETFSDLGDEIEDKIKFEVKTTKRGIKTKVEYKQKIEDETTETESETQFEVYFDSIVEYMPAAEGNAYDWGETDTVVQALDLDDWNDLSNVVDDGTTAVFTASNPDATVTFDFTISRANLNEHISANNIKIDFNVADWPWMQNDTYVALLSTVETERKIKVETDKKAKHKAPTARSASDVLISFAEVADTADFTPFGQYLWAETAQVPEMMVIDELDDTANETAAANGTDIDLNATATARTTQATVQVVATSPLVEPEARRQRRLQYDNTDDENASSKDKSNDNESKIKEVQVQSIAFSFVGTAAHRASNIFWDPEAGVGYGEASGASNTAQTLVTAVLGLAAAIFVVVW